MEAFAPGGGMAHRHSQTTPSALFSSVQFCARGELFCSKGLKEGIFLEDAEKRVLHSTCRATHHLIVSIARALPFEDPSKKASFSLVLENVEQFIDSRDEIKTSDGFCSPDNVTGGMEEQGCIQVDAICRGHKVKAIMGCGDVQQEQENFICDGFLPSSSHPEASFLLSSKPYDSGKVNFTSLQAVDIPSALTLHISCQDVQHTCSSANESCIEEAEGPSTPDLQPEGRSWVCEVLGTKGADDMLPSDNLLMEQEEDVMSACMLQCQKGPMKCLDALMQRGKDACKDDSSLPGKSYTFSDYCERGNRRHALRKSNSTASRRYVTSSLRICAAPCKKKSHSRALYILHLRLPQQKCINSLKGKKSEVKCEQLLADIQFHLRAYKLRLVHDRGEKEIDASTAACYSRNALSSKMGINSASKLPNSLEVNDDGLPRSTATVMDDFKADASHRPIFVTKVDEWNSIPIDQVDECLDTCLAHLQPRRSSDLAPHSKEVFQEGNKYEANYLPTSAVDKHHSHTQSQCISSLSLDREELRSSMLHHERQSKEKLKHFAEGFLLRRHILQQQRRAQKSPPFPPGDSVRAAVDDNGASRRLLANVRANPYTYVSMQASIKRPEVKNHEPTVILTSSLTKPGNVASRFCNRDGCIGADVVIDIVGLVKYIESHSSLSETFTDVVAHSINCTHIPLTGGQLVIPNVGAVIVTIVAIVVYTKVLLEGALAWVGVRTQSKEDTE